MLQENYSVNVPFLSDLSHNNVMKGQHDLTVLRFMVRQLLLTLRTIEQTSVCHLPLRYELTERTCSMHRMMIFQPQALLLQEQLSFVGFVSGYQEHVDPTLLDEMSTTDAGMLSALKQISGLLSYSSLELRKRRWYNLVILRSFDSKADLRQIPLHQHAAYSLAPRVYDWIRLHSGIFPGGLVSNVPELIRSRHYIFQAVKPYCRMSEVTYSAQNQ
jgi:hypothetical protein